jgi:hypothetical protein
METPPPLAVRLGQTTLNWAESTQRTERLFPAKPKIGLIVGTFAAVPFVHLHLETRRRLYPEIPMLLHDDCSPATRELENLCAEYGVEFASTVARFQPCKGDLSAIATGLVWARARPLDIVVKMSRRFLPLKPWVADLSALAMASHYATYSSWTSSFDFGFRTECVGFAVEEWCALGLIDEIADTICKPEQPFVEGFIHGLARHCAMRNTRAAKAFDTMVGPRPANRDGYAVWPFMGTDRCARSDNFLWHDWATSEDYSAQARRLGLPYSVDDFRDPNAGC